MMKNFIYLSIAVVSIVCLVACEDSVRREPGKVYMPDMAYSRAYETYDDHSNLANDGINFTNMPVKGTISRGEEMPYHIANDTTGYTQSNTIENPIKSLTPAEFTETERQYLINCAICHGANLNGNGPLYKDGNGPYAAKPATLVGDPVIEAKGEGDYFHVQTYGKGQMGSYSAQLNRTQRWMLAKYIKLKQQEKNGGGSATPAKDSAAAPTKPTTSVAKN